jgi:hypothetical protein
MKYARIHLLPETPPGELGYGLARTDECPAKQERMALATRRWHGVRWNGRRVWGVRHVIRPAARYPADHRSCPGSAVHLQHAAMVVQVLSR